MYEILILALLTRQPMHGYLIIRVINDMIGPFAKLSNGRLYPLLTKLEMDGLIATVPGDQRQRTFVITDEGRVRFHRLMMDTTANPGDYARLFWLKVPFCESLTIAEQRYLIDHYLNYCQAHIVHLTGELTEMEVDAPRRQYMTPEQIAATMHVIRHLRNQWQLDHNDVLMLRAETAAHAEGRNAGVVSPEGPVAAWMTENEAGGER